MSGAGESTLPNVVFFGSEIPPFGFNLVVSDGPVPSDLLARLPRAATVISPDDTLRATPGLVRTGTERFERR